MAQFDLVIRNGTVATAADTFTCDIGVKGGQIAALSDRITDGETVIDATDRLVLPGGIDSHCHLDQPSYGGAECADDFRSGTISAACGGNTVVMPFAMATRGQPLRQVVDDYRKRAARGALIDYAIHLIVPDGGSNRIGQEIPPLIAEGYTSFKIYLTYEGFKLNDRECLDVLAVAKREGALVMVHAENDDAVNWLTEGLVNAGHTALKYHALARSSPVEREATHRAIALAELVGVPILVVHVSSRDAMEQIRWAQQRGLQIYAETCPQYLFLSEDDLARPGFEGAKFVCAPPPRAKDNQADIWRGLQQGVFNVVSSDHSPYRYADPKGKMRHGPDAPFYRVANGVPGLEVRLPLLFSEGVLKGRLTLQQFVALASTNAARIYGLYPRKGTIAVGSDADLAIWDPECKVTLTHKVLHDNMDYTPYEGMRVTGWPVTTISRGEVVWNDGKVLGAAGRGCFLRCDRPARANRQESEVARL